MSERIDKFTAQLDQLIKTGGQLHNAIQFECHPKEFEKELESTLGKDKEAMKNFIAALPNFRQDYQTWYSEAQAVIKQVIPDRLKDFVSYFEYPGVRKTINFQNYMIRDYLQGLNITGWGKEVVVSGSAAIPEFTQQLNILKAAKATLNSILMDLKFVIQADLFDTEIDSARALAKAGYLRASGAVCGVVMEKHLAHVCNVHGITIKKKNPTISDLSQLLRDANVTTVPTWRFIQHLADIRNLCDHAKSQEPTKEEIQDLVAGDLSPNYDPVICRVSAS